MKYLKPIWLLIRYSLRHSMRSKIGMILSLSVPLAYTVAYVLQVIINYRINPDAFVSLPISYYFVALFTSQSIVFTAWERSPRELARKVLTSEIDNYLLRPVNLFYFKYFRHIDIIVPVMITLYISGVLVSFSFTGLPLHILIYIFIIIICGTLIKLNVRSAARGLVFFYRDILNTTRVEESLDGLTQNKPPEVFPTVIKVLLTICLPFMLFNNSTFEVVRSLDTPFFWFILYFWTILSMFINKYIWLLGLKNYESIG